MRVTDANKVIYNVALNTRHGTSGFDSEWKCIFNRDAEVPSELDVNLSYDKTKDGVVIVYWKRHTCSRPGQARVATYTVKFKTDASGERKLVNSLLFVQVFF